jgi:hypothetical protein
MADLASAGLMVIRFDGGFEFANKDNLSVTVGPSDIAAGIVRLADDPERLKEWAALVMAASGFLDLKLDSTPDGERLLEALWDLTFGEQLDDDTLALARDLARLPQ